MHNTTTRWETFFDNHLTMYHSLFEYAFVHWNYNLPVFSHIQKLCPAPARVLEVGCGLGASAVYLQGFGYTVTAVDNNLSLVERARETARHFHAELQVEQADAFNLSVYYKQFDIVYSIGVLEHFERDITIELLREQAKCGHYVVLGVPSRFTSLITDERIYTLPQLRRIVREAGLNPVTSFGYGHPKELLFFRRLLPHALYRILQDYCSLAQGLVVIGEMTKGEHGF